ncbi:hypothetical protein FHS78_000639 [Parvibaculum indicum]|uniref:hypothetical protein n=1 Tax=Parvibaculum indicum TaxID=562969 RepID=UPI00141EAB38|nr:hypothetical protein [Parvibaculum indicum]NIJ40369.1 hypothetical protein [Parvibaculum indicum]
MTDITYAKAGGPPEDWTNIEVVDIQTGNVIDYVVEVDTIAGWLRKYKTDENGKLALLPDGKTPQIEALCGRFAIRRRT